jgi:hypothetical protein
MILFKNQTTDTAGSQSVFKYSQRLPGKQNIIMAEGTFDGGTVSLEARRPGRDWVTITDSEFTAEGQSMLNGGSFDIRGALSGAGASTDVTLEIVE